ncbi:MAG: C45 family autoproteolytic acyltransferase/hydrolase [Verrucomicrobiota bacterium]
MARTRLKRWLLASLAGAMLMLLLGALTVHWLLLHHWTAKPPPLPADTSIIQLKPETRDGKIWLGKSWAGTREGLPVIFLKGTPFEIGYAHGFLDREKMHTLENEFLEMIHGYVPQQWKIDLLKNYVIYRNRHLSDFIPLSYRMEIYGTTLGATDVHPEEGSFYNRLLNYHAAHDVSYMLIDNPLVSKAGCTAFGAWGSETQNGHLITGRNFDWEAAEVFSRDRVVILCEPDGAIPFISLAWAGMAGVVSGMNREGISVTVNGAPSGLPDETATPVAIVAREILEHSHSLGEALDILKRAKVFVSTLWLVGSRVDGRFVVVEKTPAVTQVREPESDSIICANHFQTDGLKDSERNKNYRAEATSVSREDRLKELLRAKTGKVDAMNTAGILRDRDLPGNIFLGNGHRGTLNALIATHATIMDLTDGIFWASSPPNQLGKFVAFDLKDFSHELPERTLQADPILVSGEFERARAAQKNLKEGALALKKGDAKNALEHAEKAEALNPAFYQNAWLKGRALLALNRVAEAEESFQRALTGRPAFLAEKRELETQLQRAQKSK